MKKKLFLFGIILILILFGIILILVSRNGTTSINGTIARTPQERCEKTGGTWISGERCKQIPDGTEYCTKYQECQCPEGFIFRSCGVCTESLETGTLPTTQEECEDSGGEWKAIGGDKATRDWIYGCRCKWGTYTSKENRCEKKPKEYLCKSTCGKFVDNECICPDNQIFSETGGCHGTYTTMT